MTGFLLKVLAAYLLGSMSGSLSLGRLRHVDIRTMGSGNAGGTNAFRTQGVRFALGVVIVDVGKAVLATWLVPGLDIPGLATTVAPGPTMLACGFAAVVGHCYPVYHGFRGGKGAATAVGSLLIIQPWLLVPMLSTWLLTLGLTGYVSVATILSGFSLVPGALWLGASKELLAYCLALALFMTFTHRGNLRNLRAGTENRFERARIVNWFRSGPG
jgi:glycerol-3-phosphate acyltransferase PlsY